MKKESSISLKQQQILDVIQAAIKAKGYPPSVREIGEAVGQRPQRIRVGHGWHRLGMQLQPAFDGAGLHPGARRALHRP